LKKLFLFSYIVLVSVSCTIYRKIANKEDHADSINPERGFYIPSGTKAGNFLPLNVSALKSYRKIPQYIVTEKIALAFLDTLYKKNYIQFIS